MTCIVRTLGFAEERSLMFTPTDGAREPELLSSAAHAHVLRFGTSTAGAAGLRIRHALAFTTSSVEVLPGAAVPVRVDVQCAAGLGPIFEGGGAVRS